MSERLPSARALSLMATQDQFWILQRIADELRQEREHILSGYYRPWSHTHEHSRIEPAPACPRLCSRRRIQHRHRAA